MNIDHMRTGMAESILREVARALTALAETGTRDAIDLRSLPMTAADREALETRLGRGEAEVILNAAGTSEIWETRFAGVWWLRHFAGNGQVAAEVLEITPVPDMVIAHPDDIGAAAAVLRAEIERKSEEAHHA